MSGNLPARLDCYLSASHLKGVEDYEPADSTVTVQAGTRLRELQQLLAKSRQFMPWDPPSGERATVGGVLASGEPGFRRQPGARPRDLLLGFDALLADGTPVSAGGRVVKNVAGYELMKLLVGSRGTLAFLTRVHLRVRPIPETTVTLAVSLRDASSISEAISVLGRGAFRPEVIAVADPSLAATLSFNGWLLLLRYEGIDEEVSDHCDRSEDLLRGNEVFRPTPGESEILWDRLRDFPASSPESPMVVLGQVLPSQTVSLAEEVASERTDRGVPGRRFGSTRVPKTPRTIRICWRRPRASTVMPFWNQGLRSSKRALTFSVGSLQGLN